MASASMISPECYSFDEELFKVYVEDIKKEKEFCSSTRQNKSSTRTKLASYRCTGS